MDLPKTTLSKKKTAKEMNNAQNQIKINLRQLVRKISACYLYSSLVSSQETPLQQITLNKNQNLLF